jgi:hypothetical protein
VPSASLKKQEIIMTKKNQIILKTLCLCVFVVSLNLAATDSRIISLQPECRTFYADREHTFTVVTKSLTGESLNWNLRYAGRTLAAGKRTIPENGEVKISFQFPKLNPGVIAETEFSCWVGKKALGTRSQALGKNEHRTSNKNELRRNLFFFNPNPFEGQKKALEERQIGVWEASEGGTLSELLKSLEVPFAEVADPEQFNGDVLLVIGIDFDSSPGTFDALLDLVKKGKKIIIMPPTLGKFPLNADKLDGIILGGNEYIGIRSQALGIRKKFDTKTWNGKAIPGKTFKLIPFNDTVGLEINNTPNGFSFCELRIKEALGTGHQALREEGGKAKGIKNNAGRMIITTLDIINGAKVSPTPAYLLKELIRRD